MDKPVINPYLALLFGVFAVSFSAIFIRLCDAPPLVIATYRMGFTSLIIAPFTLYTGWKELSALSKKDLFYSLISGFCLSIHFVLWMYSLQYTSVASAVVLVNTQPIFVALATRFLFQERISKILIIGIGIALLGSTVIAVEDFNLSTLEFLGDMLALGGSITFAAYFLIGGKLRKRLNLLPYVLVVYSMCTFILIILCLITRTPLYPYLPFTYLLFLLLAIVPTIFGHTVFNWSLRYIETSIVAVSILGEPIGATILAILFLGEIPSVVKVLGGALILFGIYISANRSKVVEERALE